MKNERFTSCLWVGAAMVLAGCATSPRPHAPVANTTRSSSERLVEELLGREGTAPLSEQDFALPDGSFRGRVRGLAAPTVRPAEGFALVTVPVPGGEPVKCQIYPHRIDPAVSLRAVYEEVKTQFEQTRVYGYDAGFAGDTAYLDLSALYLVASPRGNLLGMLKMRAANVGERAVLCTHDMPGFVRTFDQVTRPLLAVPPGPVTLDRFLVYMGDRPIGFDVSAVVRDGNGGQNTDAASMLFARSPTDVVATDRASVIRWSPTGESVEEFEESNQNGQLSRYALRREGQTRQYRVEGVHLGRAFQGTFVADRPLVCSEPALEQMIPGLLAPGTPATSSTLQYDPTANPLGPTEATYTYGGAAEHEHLWVIVRVGSWESRLLARRSGKLDEIRLESGGQHISLRRVTE